MQPAAPYTMVLEFARAEDSGDPYAFHFGKQRYLVRSSDGGFESIELDWSDALRADLEAVRRPGRDPALVQRLGELLRQLLGPADYGTQEAAMLAAIQAQREVLLTVRSAAAELYTLPWELLTLKSSGQHLSQLPNLLIRYEWPQCPATPADPAALRDGGRILFAWSAAAGAVPAGEQLDALEAACLAGYYPFSRQADVLANVSARRLVETLQQAQSAGAPFVVLQLLCHGAAAGDTFGLALDGDNPSDGRVVVDAGRLRGLLKPFAGTLRLIILSACDSGNSGGLGNRLGSVAQTLHRVGIAHVVASRYPLSVSGAIRLTEVLYRELLEHSGSLERSLRNVVQRLAEDANELDWASLQLYSRAADGNDSRPLVLRPYRGLLPFQPEHQRFFFGREKEVVELEQDLTALSAGQRPRFLIVAGASGTGKSSVVLAGAVPRLLAKNPGSRAAKLRPGSDPESALQAALAELEAQPDSAPAPGAAKPLRLLVVDQLEEIFTHVSEAPRRQLFVQKLWQLASDPESQLAIVATLRVDFIGRCGELTLDAGRRRFDTVAYDEAHRVFVAQLGATQLRAVIAEPAWAVGLAFEDGLVERMVQDVGDEPGALPLLEDTLDVLWQQRRGRLLTQDSYSSLGGVAGALKGRAQTLIDGLGDEERRTARRLMVRLVSISDDVALSTRRCVALHELRPQDSVEAERFDKVVERLVEARLLVQTEKEVPGQPSLAMGAKPERGVERLLPPGWRPDRAPHSRPPAAATDTKATGLFLEVAHEALIRQWALLRTWVTEDRRLLGELAKLEQWVHQYHELNTLLVGSALGSAIELAGRYPHDLPHGASELIAKSQQLARRQQRIRIVSVAVAVVTTVVFAALLWDNHLQDSRSHDQAVQRRKLSQLARDGQRLNAALLSRHAWTANAAYVREVEVSNPEELLPSWLPLATDAVLNLEGGEGFGGEPELPAAASPPVDCRPLVATSERSARRKRTTADALPSASPAAAAPVAKLPQRAVVAMSSDGRRSLLARPDFSALVWQSERPREPRQLLGHLAPIVAAALSSDGRRAVTADSGELRWWALDKESPPQVLQAPGTLCAALRSDGEALAVGTQSGDVLLWQSAGREPPLRFPHSRAVRALGFSPDGRQLASLTEDDEVDVWDIASRRLLASLKHATPLESSPASRAEATAAPDTRIDVLHFTPSGRQLATSRQGQGVTLWAWGESARSSGETMLAVKSIKPSSIVFTPSGEEALILVLGDVWILGRGGALKQIVHLPPVGERGIGQLVRVGLSQDGSELLVQWTSGKVMRWRLLREPAKLMQRLWELDRVRCTPVFARKSNLREESATAKRSLEICQSFQRCLRPAPPAPAPDWKLCQAAFAQQQSELYAQSVDDENPLFDVLVDRPAHELRLRRELQRKPAAEPQPPTPAPAEDDEDDEDDED